MKKIVICLGMVFSLLLVGCSSVDDQVDDAIRDYGQYCTNVTSMLLTQSDSDINKVKNNFNEVSGDLAQIYSDLEKEDGEAAAIVGQLLNASYALDTYIINSVENGYSQTSVIYEMIQYITNAQMLYESYYGEENEILIQVIDLINSGIESNLF